MYDNFYDGNDNDYDYDDDMCIMHICIPMMMIMMIVTYFSRHNETFFDGLRPT